MKRALGAQSAKHRNHHLPSQQSHLPYFHTMGSLNTLAVVSPVLLPVHPNLGYRHIRTAPVPV